MKTTSFFACLMAAGAIGWAGSAAAQDCVGGDCGGCVAGDCGVGGCAAGGCTHGGRGVGCHSLTSSASWGCAGDSAPRSPDGSIIADCTGHRRYPPAPALAAAAAQDRFHLWPTYAYSPAGIDATRIHTWHYNQAQMYPWHGGYYHRQWGEPLALVVPPTSAYHTTYSWGVAQTTSLPIYHQFLRPYPGPSAGGAGMFSPPPYWPSNTNQFGVYPVRGSW